MSANNILSDKKFSPDKPEKKPIVDSSSFNITRLCLKKGVIVPPHDDTHSAFFLVLEGKGMFTHGKGEVELGQNDFLYIKVGESRGIRSLEDLVVLAINE